MFFALFSDLKKWQNVINVFCWRRAFYAKHNVPKEEKYFSFVNKVDLYGNLVKLLLFLCPRGKVCIKVVSISFDSLQSNYKFQEMIGLLLGVGFKISYYTFYKIEISIKLLFLSFKSLKSFKTWKSFKSSVTQS